LQNWSIKKMVNDKRKTDNHKLFSYSVEQIEIFQGYCLT
jgi:hypothetical protein